MMQKTAKRVGIHPHLRYLDIVVNPKNAISIAGTIISTSPNSCGTAPPDTESKHCEPILEAMTENPPTVRMVRRVATTLGQ